MFEITPLNLLEFLSLRVCPVDFNGLVIVTFLFELKKPDCSLLTGLDLIGEKLSLAKNRRMSPPVFTAILGVFGPDLFTRVTTF